MSQPIVNFLDTFTIPEKQLKYAIVCSQFQKQWVFVRHKLRSTWEMPAGHIEKEESALAAARRELYEETGATDFSLRALYDYSCVWHGETNYGRIFFADIKQLGELPKLEIAEIHFFKNLPENLTYPDIQNLVFEKVKLSLIETSIKFHNT